MKTNKIIYWSATGLLSGLLLMSAGMYVFKNEMINQAFTGFGYPTYLIYPLVVLKVTAVIVLLTQKQNFIKNLAYAGLFFEFILAFFAHIMTKDGEQITSVIAMLLLVCSYIYSSKVFNLKIK